MRTRKALLIAIICTSALLETGRDQSFAVDPCGNVRDDPDLTCVPITSGLLMSLRFAQRKAVVTALQSPGETMSGGALHYRSVGAASEGSGDLLITIGTDDRVSELVATVDQGSPGATQMFSFSAQRGRACGDLAGVPSCDAKH